MICMAFLPVLCGTGRGGASNNEVQPPFLCSLTQQRFLFKNSFISLLGLAGESGQPASLLPHGRRLRAPGRSWTTGERGPAPSRPSVCGTAAWQHPGGAPAVSSHTWGTELIKYKATRGSQGCASAVRGFLCLLLVLDMS